MRSLNKLALIGNVGSDPEVRSTNNGTHVATLSLATTEQWGSGNAKQEKTEWHRVVLWSGLADIAEKYIKKGDRLYIEGRVEYRTWEDKDGNTRYTTEVVGKELVMLGGKSTAGRNASRADDEGEGRYEDDDNPHESAGKFFDRKADEARAAKGGKKAGKKAAKRSK